MQDVKAQLANRLKEANNVLVSVTNNPSVDQFAAAVALTLILNKLGKHATTVFSGNIPSTIEFLNPEKVVEKNTDSLRDFIISLDKSKADKLRYKIEDNFVKIFITPYHSSIGESDLVFSQGDFNVDVVVGLGVHKREELDQAITIHGRILHDATVTTINTQEPSDLGSINWSDNKSSSICEMLVALSDLLAQQGLLDTQISNALLTGIVAETQRFSNQKTTSVTMSASSKLLASGANQQLVAIKMAPKPMTPPPPPPPKPVEKPVEPEKPPAKEGKPLPKQLKSVEKNDKKKNEFGVLEVNHDDLNNELANEDAKPEEQVAQVLIDDQGTLKTIDPNDPSSLTSGSPPDVDKKEDHKEEDKSKEPDTESLTQSPPPPPIPDPVPPPMPTYIPPPLIPIPPDPSLSNPPPPPPATPPSEPNQGNSDSSSLFQGPKLDMQPPSITGQVSTNEFGDAQNDSFSDPSANGYQGSSSGLPTPTPMLSHDSAVANSSTQSPPPTSGFTNPLPQNSNNQQNLANLSQVREAVNSALADAPPTVANQPLASVGSQEVKLDLNPLSAPASTTSPLLNNPNVVTPIEPGSSMDPKIISPDVLTGQAPPSSDQGSMPAPPVPPPIVPINDNNNLPPSFTAL